MKKLKLKRASSVSPKSINIALFGVGFIFLILLVGAVVVIGSLLEQFTGGRIVPDKIAPSDYKLGVLQVRDMPADFEEQLSGVNRIDTMNASRMALRASTVVRVYGPGSIWPDVISFGVLMEENGYVITSAAVVRSESLIEVELYGGDRFRGRLIGYDLKTDVAVIKVDGSNLRTATFGNSDMKEGESIIYVGLGQNGIISISEGTVGGTAGVYIDTPAGYAFLNLTSTDRLSSDKHAGGIVVNSAGQIVGLRCSWAHDSYHFTYALSMNELKAVIDGITEDGYVKNRYTLAFKGETVSKVLADSLGYPRGVAVERIESISDMLNRDIQEGDIITSFAGIPVNSVEELEGFLRLPQQEEVALQVFRPADKKTFETNVFLLEDTGLYIHR